MNTKIHAVVDAAGQPVRLFLSPGNEADITHAHVLLEEIPAAMMVADNCHDNDPFPALAEPARYQAMHPAAVQSEVSANL